MKKLFITILILAFAVPAFAQYDKHLIRKRHAYGDELWLDNMTVITGDWSCAGTSITCTEDATSGAATAELSAGDFIVMQTGSDWYSYEVESVTDDDTFVRKLAVSSETNDPLRAVTASKVWKDLGLGVATDGTTSLIKDGLGTSLSLSIGDYLLDEASGDEYALKLLYTTNKVAGNDYGLYINMTDTLSGGNSYPFWVGINSASVLYVENGVTKATSFIARNADWGLLNISGLALANDNSISFSTTSLYTGARDISLFRYNDTFNTYLALGDGAGVAISDVTGRLLVGPGTAAAPSVAIYDGTSVDNGFYAQPVDVVGVSIGGTGSWAFSTTSMSGLGNLYSASLLRLGSTTTAPTFLPDRSDTNTGISGGAAGNDGQTYMIADAVAIFHTDNEGPVIDYGPLKYASGSTIGTTDATPDVSAGTVFTFAPASAGTVVTDLDNPVVGSTVILIGGGGPTPSTIADGGNFNLSGAWTAAADDVLTLYIQADNDYIEISRSDN